MWPSLECRNRILEPFLIPCTRQDKGKLSRVTQTIPNPLSVQQEHDGCAEHNTYSLRSCFCNTVVLIGLGEFHPWSWKKGCLSNMSHELFDYPMQADQQPDACPERSTAYSHVAKSYWDGMRSLEIGQCVSMCHPRALLSFQAFLLGDIRCLQEDCFLLAIMLREHHCLAKGALPLKEMRCTMHLPMSSCCHRPTKIDGILGKAGVKKFGFV